jgi:hypothetical protein
MYNPTYVHGKVEHMEIAPKRLCSYCMYLLSGTEGVVSFLRATVCA